MQVTSKPILVYPNSGETYDGEKKEWVVSLFSTIYNLSCFYNMYGYQMSEQPGAIYLPNTC